MPKTRAETLGFPFPNRDDDSKLKIGRAEVAGPEPCVKPMPPMRGHQSPVLAYASKHAIWLTLDKDGRLGGASLSQAFWYLAGPMSNIKGFNFAEFDRIADNLRDHKFNVCSPAELDHEIERAAAAESPDGRPDNTEFAKPWVDCMQRDIMIVAMPECLGVVAMVDWPNSSGAKIETQVAAWLQKPIFLYRDYEDENCSEYTLTKIDRDNYYHEYMRHMDAGAAVPAALRPYDVAPNGRIT